jgi:hypothetical protein
MNTDDYQAYVVFQEQRDVLKAICDRLHSGSDAMRDEGHKLWLILNQMKGQRVEVTHDGGVQ